MLIFKSIKYKNFLSSGPQFTEVPIDDSKITVVTGSNGAGKSTIIASIYYALYGKAFSKVNKDALINSVSKKQMVVELTLEQAGNTFLIKRGQKPNIFEIYKNGVLEAIPSNVKDYQSWLVNNVLKMDEKTFRQIVIMGSSAYVPFLQLSAYERRTVIEDILDIDIFSIMNSIAKDNLKNINSDMESIKNNIKQYEWKLDGLKKSAQSLDNNLQSSIEEYDVKINVISQKLDDFVVNLEELDNTINSFNIDTDKTKWTTTNKQINELNKLLAKKEQIALTHSKSLKFFTENSACPYCTQSLESDTIKAKIDDYKKFIINDQNDLKLFHEKINELIEFSNNLAEKMSEVDKYKSKYISVKNEYDSANKQLLLYKKVKQDAINKMSEIKIDNSAEIYMCTDEIKKLTVNLNNISSNIDSYKVILDLLKDDGVKSIIIKNYLPIINMLMKKYLSIIGFDVTFQFDENFNETLKTKENTIYEYGSFSEGEKLRINFALLFTFRELSKLRSSVHTNILLLDEFSDRLDNDGITALSSLFEKAESNVIIISHYPEQFLEIADRHIKVEKKNKFSEISF